MSEEKFKKELTDEEIDEEVLKLEAFFKQIPEDKKILTAHSIIFYSVLYSSRCMCHGLEILDAAKVGFAEIMSEDMEEDVDDDIEDEDND